MAEVITTAPKSEEAEIELLIIPLGELTSHLSDNEASTAIKAIANFVNRRSPGDKQMLPVSDADIASKHTDIVALRLPETEDVIDANFITNNVVGYVGAMKPIRHGARLMSEVGSLKVDDSLRGHGVGTILFENYSGNARRRNYALCILQFRQLAYSQTAWRARDRVSKRSTPRGIGIMQRLPSLWQNKWQKLRLL